MITGFQAGKSLPNLKKGPYLYARRQTPLLACGTHCLKVAMNFQVGLKLTKTINHQKLSFLSSV